ncbi:MAG: sulfite exporter TauE/SafE family protein, partial [Deltaproteobacteria bacterium]|nr:sulfite exporter TauE/SafE family protein [Deltaproteobacteria bacterium]
TVGAAGGILASFGFITVLHIHAANSVKVMSQILIIISPIIALPIYLRQDRTKQIKSILFYLGFIIASGAILGALFGSWFSKNFLFELKSFKYLFGYLTFLVVAMMIYNILKQRKKKKAEPDAKKSDEDSKDYNIPSVIKFSVKKIDFRCLRKDYSVSPIILFIAGFVIATLSSIFGVGGGFLIVPFLTDAIGLPVFLAAGISILVVFISSLTSVSNYLRMGVPVIIPILLVTIAGVVAGSVIGPKISQRLNEKMLKYILMVLLVFIGVFYVFKP